MWRVSRAGVGGRFQHGAAEAARQAAFFDGDDEAGSREGPQDRVAVERLDEAGVDDADVEALVLQHGRAAFTQAGSSVPQATSMPSAPQSRTSALAELDGRRRRARRFRRSALG